MTQLSAGRQLRALAALGAVSAAAVLAPSAQAIVGGTTQVSAADVAPVAYIEIHTPTGTYSCSGTLISPTVVMTAAHCVYEESSRGNLLGIARPSDVSVRIGSTNVLDPALGTAAGVVAVLPQPHYRWDGGRHYHDVALLALDRPMPETPATLAEQAPTAGEPLLIAGYGQISTTDRSGPSVLRAALIDAADPASCKLVSEHFDPSWLFCGAASTDPAQPGGTACYGDSGGPAFAHENAADNVVVEGVMSYVSRDCEFSRTYLVLVSSERGSSIARSRRRPSSGAACATTRRSRAYARRRAASATTACCRCGSTTTEATTRESRSASSHTGASTSGTPTAGSPQTAGCTSRSTRT